MPLQYDQAVIVLESTEKSLSTEARDTTDIETLDFDDDEINTDDELMALITGDNDTTPEECNVPNSDDCDNAGDNNPEDESHLHHKSSKLNQDSEKTIKGTADDPASESGILASVLLKRPPYIISSSSSASTSVSSPSPWRRWFSKRKATQKRRIDKINSESGLIFKFIKCIKRSLSSGSFYFSYDIDLTSSLKIPPGPIPFNQIKDDFYFNRYIMSEFEGTCLVLPIVQGFVGHCQIPLIRTENNCESPPVAESEELDPPIKFNPLIDNDVEFNDKEAINVNDGSDSNEKADLASLKISGDLFLISRRSVKRAGVRYLRRGIDDNGYCANWVETEQLLQLPLLGNKDDGNSNNAESATKTTCSFIQVRGSLPVYFSQSPYKLQPTPRLLRVKDENIVRVFTKHFRSLQSHYGQVVGISLVEKSPSRESTVGQMYKQLADDNGVYVEWFDFHRVTKGLQFNQVETLFNTKIGIVLDDFGWTDTYKCQNQKGIFRINCIDCLDRTNVVETSIARRILRKSLATYNFTVDDLSSQSSLLSLNFEKMFNNIWADNGDAISQQYSSTNALKGDFTRTSQRNYKGVLNDAFLTLSRYFYGMVSDFFMQAVIDYILGNVSEQVFDDFEENMESRDSSVNLGSIRSSAIEAAATIVLSSEQEVLYGGWWLLTPRKGELRRAELKDTILLVSDSAVYVCDFDLDAEKVVDFHRIPSRCISVIQKGSFFGEILSSASKNPARNRGILIKYSLKGVTSASDNTNSSRLPLSSELSTSHGIDVDSIERTDVDVEQNGSSQSPVLDQSFIAFKVPTSHSEEFATILGALQQCCPGVTVVEEDIVGLVEATSGTGIWETLEYYMKRAVWA